MTPVATALNPIVTTATRGAVAEKMLDAPASISVVTADQIAMKPVVLPTEYLKTLPGVSYSTAGLGQANIVVRGFNDAFSGAMLNLQDYRYSGVPGLRVNVPFLYTGTSDDIDRIEVLNGPAAALYGPNAASGVLHVITKSPLTSQGNEITVDGGSRSIVRVAGRSAHTLDAAGEWGAKISGEYFRGIDWPNADPNLPAVFPNTAPPVRAGQTVERGTLVRRFSTEGRLDYRSASTGLENILTLGYTKGLNSNDITAVFGPVTVRDWSYTSVQDRLRYKGFFAQVFRNASNSGNDSTADLHGTYYLATGIPIVDNSSVTTAQVQQSFSVRRAEVIVGADHIATDLRSMGTVYGRYETTNQFGRPSTREDGAYLHATVPFASHFEAVASARVDESDRLPGTQVSPRVGVVARPNDVTNLRLTFSRAFNSPFGYEYFIDQIANPNQAPGFALRIVGNPPKSGWQYDRGCDAAVNAGLCMHSPWAAQGGGAEVASSAASSFPGFVVALPSIVASLPSLTAAQRAQLTGLLGQLKPILTSLRPTSADVGTTLNAGGTLAASQVNDIQPLRASFNDSWEAGYKGIIANRLRVALDLWYEIRGGEGTALATNPVVLFEPNSLGAYLVKNIVQALVAQGQSQAQAAATANAAAGALVPVMAALPQGTLAFTNPLNSDASIIATYTQGSDKLHVAGADLAADYQASDAWTLRATYSFQNKVVFRDVGASGGTVMSNTPKHHASAGVRLAPATARFGFDATVRYADAFPVSSGYYNSNVPNSFNAGFRPYAAVPSQTQIDAGVSYKIRRSRLALGINGTNLLNDRVPTFAGTPAIGRVVLTSVKAEF